jgi:MinD-like ATPase involved in chromosome partitioning or flagellar assembly
MLNLKDQAEGLRNLLGNRINKSFIVLSALEPSERNAILLNISVAIVNSGESVQLIDANRDADGISSILKNQSNSQYKTKESGSSITPHSKKITNGISVTSIFNESKDLKETTGTLKDAIKLIEENAGKSTISFIDVDINDEITEQLDEVTRGEVIVLLNNQESSIKQAYILLKRLSSKISDLKVHILVNGCNKKESQQIQKNISATASNYLSLSTTQLGIIINDESLTSANRVGKSVFDIYPKSESIELFNQIAKNILKESRQEKKSKAALHENYQSAGVQ